MVVSRITRYSHLWYFYPCMSTRNDWRLNRTKFYRAFCVFRWFWEERYHLFLNTTTLLIVVMDMECVFWEARICLLKYFDWVHTSCRILLRTIGEQSQFGSFVCLSVRPFGCPSAWNNAAPTGRIFMKSDIWMFSTISRENSSFIKIWKE